MRSEADRVALWSIALDGDPTAAAALADGLDAAELRRATEIVSSDARARFITARAFVRAVLGQELGVAPVSLAFARGPYGKPYLPGTSIRFSLSHTRTVALLAVTRGEEVGVDIEELPRGGRYERVSARCFAEAEAWRVRECDPALRPRLFATLWAAKEAYLKMTGEGLGRGLNTFVVDVGDDWRPVLSSVDGAPPRRPVALHPLDLAVDGIAMLCASAALRVGIVRHVATIGARP
ncbi:4'-phosphopantetheinyl transferase superfamily protein [Streptosporangium sp. NPDC051023]|uniref:4'-phosphopantetheinyl transferase family protein n=1 Tax=Streptosporangium sp. NPDC051023 TaxID=3155410 RepID=UPI00344DEEA6